MKRTLIFNILLPCFKWLAYRVFEKKYLQGRYFDQALTGWKWVARAIWLQKCLGFNRHVPFPCHHTVTISNASNIIFDPDDLNNFQSPGVYWQCFKAKIYLGKGSYIGPNVGLITANHQLNNLSAHAQGKDITIGKRCWLSMNCVILPGVILADGTIVAAGAVVTKSFSQGNCIIGGVPARFIKSISLDEITEK